MKNNKYNFLNKSIFCIFGLNLSGKSFFAKNIAYTTPKTVVFDVHKEYDAKRCDIYHTRTKYYPAIQTEFDKFLDSVMDNRWKMLICDEADRYIPNKMAMGRVFASYLGDYRHHKLDTIGFICRRPTQINTNIPELAHYLFIFRLTGKNDVQYLNNIADRLGDTVRELKKFHYVIVYPDRRFEIKLPLKN